MSTLKVVLFAILLIVFFVSMAIFDIVGGRRQGHLQHALRERMRHRNFSEETLEWALKHRAAASIFGQYGQRFIDPGRYTGLLNDTIRNIDLKIPTVKDVINKTRGSSVYRALGLDTLRGNVYGSLKRHASKISNHFTRQLKTVRKTLWNVKHRS